MKELVKLQRESRSVRHLDLFRDVADLRLEDTFSQIELLCDDVIRLSKPGCSDESSLTVREDGDQSACLSRNTSFDGPWKQLHENADRSASPAPVSIVFAVDAAYVVPLATAIRSVVENNKNVWPLDIHVIHEGIGEETQRRILNSLPWNSAVIRWHLIGTLAFASGFSTRPGVSKMAFAKILLPRFLPETCRRVLYLDGDILVLGALEHLWNLDLGGAVLGAVPDHWLDPVAGNRPGASSSTGVARYFNAGVLLIDLEKWRRERVSERSLEYLDRFPNTEYSDQDALNVACDGRWQLLERTWNFHFDPSQPIARVAVAQELAIIHFVTCAKPWKSGSLSPNVEFYDGFRSRTCFALTRRERLQSALKRAGSRLLARSVVLRAAWFCAKSTMRTHAVT
jgi:lipopolysaccharide biosynthesis glycosyltransferase